jgi:hypothetical protein
MVHYIIQYTLLYFTPMYMVAVYLPLLYAYVIWARLQHDCFQMPTLRLQHWVFSTQDIFMICAGYIYVQFAASLIVYVSVVLHVEYS